MRKFKDPISRFSATANRAGLQTRPPCKMKALHLSTYARRPAAGRQRKPSSTLPVSLGFLFLAVLLFSAGCASGPQERVYGDFLMVEARANDNLSSLAAKYLDDPSQGWVIAKFNRIHTVDPGQALIIPLKPFDLGGLASNGYQTVPVLRYQQFSQDSSTKTHITRGNFEIQMNYLKSNGYRVISLDQLMGFLNFQEAIPAKAVVITIDGSGRSIRDIALPILKKYGYPATLFVATDQIGGQDALTWEDLRYLDQNGVNIQSMTKSQRDLTSLKKDETFKVYWENLETEFSQSRASILRNLNKECKYLAYPFGASNGLVIALARKFGFRAAFTLKNESNPFFINNYLVGRSTVYGNDSLDQFKNNLMVIKTWN